ncbi:MULTISPECIES: YihY/virulence factor BrkB family protein [unclassified Rhizobium]|jgi:membrane protein|uniref:YihY/virulence factor BrkB family protein n=1 Tax=unclassified Rhizobium TaxID=2613769 RepID=UPI000DD8A8D5|nr:MULTISPECIES: YihY/virulence factor BrkB family protein [unclassified Rhizobium]MBB3444621.1 membrane protein [Rhizobium sp. BK379]MBB3563888.1 membrane protein [Rhizobium sp. BK512]
MPKFLRTFYDVVYDAICHLIEDDGFAMASHVALSTLLAVFPFLIFGTALANFLGADQFSTTAIHLIFDTWPEAIAKPLADQVVEVLTIPRGGLLTISVLAAAYFASNGVEALRISLNRAYRVQETRPWYFTRLASLGYVLIAVIIFAVISILLVAVPVGLDYARDWLLHNDSLEWLPVTIRQWLPAIVDTLEIVFSWRIYGTLVMLTIALLVVHLWLPSGKRRVFDVVPGVFLTLIFWLIGALIFAYYLATFANYTATYAGLASVMIVLIFLYMVGVIFIVGAEINAALMKFRVLRNFSRTFSVVGRDHAADSKPDKTANIGG